MAAEYLVQPHVNELNMTGTTHMVHCAPLKKGAV